MDESYDILIKNATIVDGTGAPKRKGDIAVRDGRIVRMGRVADREPGTIGARRVIDGTGRIAAPGFIDVHNHSDLFLLEGSGMDILLRQGVTTFSGGHCGLGTAPVGKGEYLASLKEAFGIRGAVDYDSFGEWLARVEARGLPINFIPLCGHGAIRGAVLGDGYRRPSTDEELERICALTEEALKAGAHGISTGYDGIWPGTFADSRERLRVAGITAKNGAIYTCHTRHHQYGWAAAETPEQSAYCVFHGPVPEAYFGRFHGQVEALETARATGARLHIAHLSTPYLVHQPHPPFLDEELARAALTEIVDRNRALGIDVSFNVIPCLESIAVESSVLSWFQKSVPYVSVASGKAEKWDPENCLESPEYRERVRESFREGRVKFAWIHPLADPYWFDCFVVISAREKDHQGRMVGDILRERRRGGWTDFVYSESLDILMDLVRDDPTLTWAPVVDKRQLGFRTFLKHPFCMVASDLIIPGLGGDRSSPYGLSPYTTNVFPDYVARMIREEGVLALEEGIRKLTGLPAEYLFRFKDRGVLREGYWADIVLFSLEDIAGTADFAEPLRSPRGIDYVLVNGMVALEKNKTQEGNPGRILKRI